MSYVLIIDDDLNGATSLASLLRREGLAAEVVSSAAAALAHLRHNPPALVLLDLGMPDISGFDLLEALNEDPRFEDLKVAIYSGNTDPAARAAAVRLGACDFIAKSLPNAEIAERVRALLESIEPAAQA